MLPEESGKNGGKGEVERHELCCSPENWHSSILATSTNNAEGRDCGLRHFVWSGVNRRSASSTRRASSASAPQDAWSETEGRAIGGPEAPAEG